MKSTTPTIPNPTLVWIPFTTTETSSCPVPPNTLVYVQLRDEPDTIKAESEANNAWDLHWSSHTGNNPWDIVAYAIAETNHHHPMNPHNQALHDIYQQAKYAIASHENFYICTAIEATRHPEWRCARGEFLLLFTPHIPVGDTGFWPMFDSEPRIRALDTMISLCKRNYF